MLVCSLMRGQQSIANAVFLFFKEDRANAINSFWNSMDILQTSLLILQEYRRQGLNAINFFWSSMDSLQSSLLILQEHGCVCLRFCWSLMLSFHFLKKARQM